MARSLTSIFLVLAVALSLTAGHSLAADKLKFATAIKFNPFYWLITAAAEEKGFWKRNGLQAEVSSFRGGAAMHRGFAAGAVDMGLTGTAGVIRSASAGVPVLVVADLGRQDFYIWIRADSPIRKPEQLKGAKLGVNRFGGLSHTLGRVVAKSLGLEKDIKFIAGGSLREEQALVQAGKLDGVIAAFAPKAALKHRGVIRVVLSVRDYLPKEWSDQAVVARKDFVEKNPDLVKRGVKAVLESGRLISEDPDWAIRKLEKALKVPRTIAKEALAGGAYSKDGRISQKAMKNVLALLLEYGLVSKKKAPNVRTLYTTKFTQ